MRAPIGVAAMVALLASCSDHDPLAPTPPIVVVTAPDVVAHQVETLLPATRFSELHYDNAGDDAGEAIEIEADAGTVLNGWRVVLYDGDGGVSYNVTTFQVTIDDLCEGRGVFTLTYAIGGIEDGPDGIALIDDGGNVVEFLSYEGTLTATDGPATGLTSTDIGVSQNSAPVGQSLQRGSDGTWFAAPSSFGACNPNQPPRTITFSGRTAADPALPVGFEDQLFATLHEEDLAVPAVFTWSSETPDIATIDQDGVFRALAAGTAILRATADDGTTATLSLPTRVGEPSETAVYEGNAEFGEPADLDPADDFIVRHAQFTTSWNPLRGIPNWVSYNLEATHFGLEDRCECFTFDPALPDAFPRYTTAAYTGAAAFHGYGIDRGHLARSFDRSSASLDNAVTHYFTNVIPQAADNNQGPWTALENVLSNLARLHNREVYIVAGASGSKGTVKDEGLITIPAQLWKVAVILPRDEGLEDVVEFDDVELIGVIIPNDPGIRSVPWETYRTTVEAIETLSGYDLLALLPDPLERSLESNNRPPVAVAGGPYTGQEGGAVTLNGAGSSDPEEGALTYQWDFGDGTTGSGPTVSHSWAQDGSYTVTLTVTDPIGLSSTATATASIANVAPAIGALTGATLLPGEAYNATGGFADPGAEAWSATVNYGDGGGPIPLQLSGKSFTLGHRYLVAGRFTLSVRVSDDDGTSLQSVGITVLTQLEATDIASVMVQQLIATGKISGGNGNALLSKLDGIRDKLKEGHLTPSRDKLTEFLAELADLVQNNRISAADAEPLRLLVTRILVSLSP